ncbi:MAG TPA: TlpA disulfide reductase family protein [Methylomirabilota bacterium]|jgi:peroxiredoxin|nr:TlpA disulfide reductase family protein [Methylomirabilota bacterium]
MRRPALFCAALLLLAAAAQAAPSAPGFHVTTLDGRRFELRDMLGRKVVVLRFQTSYCKACIKESAALSQVADKYRDRGVEVLAVHVQDTTADVKKFVEEQKPTYAVALDPKLTLGNRFGFRGTPFTVVIDKKGEIVARVHGEGAVRRLPRTLDPLLK